MIFDETTCVVRAVLRWTEFYAHESCGKCTPCREGTFWLVQILRRLEHGQGTEDDLEKLLDICDNILGRAFCALGDGATSPITSSVRVLPRRIHRPPHARRVSVRPGGGHRLRDTATATQRGRALMTVTANHRRESWPSATTSSP